MSGQIVTRRPPTAGGRTTATARQIPPAPFRLSCYKCRKAVVRNTIFCRPPCSCVLCFDSLAADCADQQFNTLQRTDCPSCKKVVDLNAILSFDVGARPSKPGSAFEASLQKVFMPLPTQNGVLSFDGMKRRVLSNIEHLKVEVDFLLTNVMRENMNQFRHNNGMRKQILSHQETIKSQKLSLQALQDQHRQDIEMRDQQIERLGHELDEQKELVRKFRHMSSSGRASSVGSGTRGSSQQAPRGMPTRNPNPTFGGSQQHVAVPRGMPAGRPQSRAATPFGNHPRDDYVDTSYTTNLPQEHYDERSQGSNSLMSAGIRQGLDSTAAFRMPSSHGHGSHQNSHLNKRRRVSADGRYDDGSAGHRRSSPGSTYHSNSAYGGGRY